MINNDQKSKYVIEPYFGLPYADSYKCKKTGEIKPKLAEINMNPAKLPKEVRFRFTILHKPEEKKVGEYTFRELYGMFTTTRERVKLSLTKELYDRLSYLEVGGMDQVIFEKCLIEEIEGNKRETILVTLVTLKKRK